MGGWSKGPRAAMEAGSKDCEEESLQIAFKKLKVDPENFPGVVSVSEPRVNVWSSTDSSSMKPKLSSPKDHRRGCSRKSSRGGSRNQRRRRSKSPILRSPIFTYSSSLEPCASSGSSSGSLPELHPGVHPITPAFPHSLGSTEERSCEGEEPDPAGFTDFAALSRLCSGGSTEEPGLPGSGTWGKRCGSGGEEEKAAAGEEVKEVFSFSGFHHSLPECERTFPSFPDAPGRTLSAAAPPASLSRSCSEQARVCIDDFTIEDLCGYMEYFLYIPKDMSHMAEMMYT